MLKSPRAGNFFLIYALALVALAVFLPRVGQDEAYHGFALDRPLAGIPRFWNVASNLPFILVALYGWMRPDLVRDAISETYRAGLFLTGFGSAYYHWSPTTERLFWDRLPMTIAFGAVVAGLVAQRIDTKLGKRMLWPLVLASIGSAVYWRWTEQQGHGNLIPYATVQFGTVLLMLGVQLFCPEKGTGQRLLWGALGLYICAKLLEHFDRPIATALGFMSGHPIKHVAAAAGCLLIDLALFNQRKQGADAGVVQSM